MRSRYRFAKIVLDEKPKIVTTFGNYHHNQYEIDLGYLHRIIKAHDIDATMITRWKNWEYTYEVDDHAIVAIALSIEACNYKVVILENQK